MPDQLKQLFTDNETMIRVLVDSATAIIQKSIETEYEYQGDTIRMADTFLAKLFEKGILMLDSNVTLPTPNPFQHHGRTEE